MLEVPMSELTFHPGAVPIALCAGGLDPSAGAGVLRDALTLAALGVHPMALTLAETIQNGVACEYIEAPVASPLLRLEALRPHLSGAWGVKVGLSALNSLDFRALAGQIHALNPTVKIWDPILGPTAGTGLHDGAGLIRMADILLSTGSWVVSPNRQEAGAMLGLPLETAATGDPLGLARPFLDRGARAVWLKGGHGAGQMVEDFWVVPGHAHSLGAVPRLLGELRGTGCVLGSAWLGFRLRGMEDIPAAEAAAAWLRDRWSRAFCPGRVGRPCLAPEARL